MLFKVFTLHNTGQVKAVGDGKVTAVFSTLNTIDKDQDVTLPGAFGAQKAKISPAHDWAEPGMGVADIREEGNEAIAEMKFYLDMASASEWYKSIKNNFDNGVPQEYSYGYDVLDSGQGTFGDKPVRFLKSLKVHEVSPVMIGAGVNTRTMAAKYAGAKQAIGAHKTATSDKAWDGPANEKRVKTDESASYFGKIYAWRDPDGDPKKKSSYRFIHHEVNEDGEPGAANLKACVSAIGVLNGGRGVDASSQPWSKDREGIYKHLAKHIKDAGEDPPELKSIDGIQTKSVEGSWEDIQEEILDAANDLLVPPPINGQPQGWVCLAATMPTSCVIAFYPTGTYEATYYQFDWTLDEAADVVTLANRREVELPQVIQPKSFERRVQIVRDHLASIETQSKSLKEGRVLSSANRDKLTRLLGQIESARAEISKLLTETDPSSDGKSAEVFKLFAQSQRTLARVSGHIR